MLNKRFAAIIGMEHAFGSEIAARLALDGYAVHDCAADHSGFFAMPEGVQAPAVGAGDPTPVRALFSGVRAVDVLVVNVPAYAGETGFLDVSDAQFDGAMRHFLFEPVAAAKQALPFLARGSRIVFVSSKGYLGAWGGAHLMAASAALVAMARSMSLELAATDITVNVVAPDFVGSKWDEPQSRRSVGGAVSYMATPDIGVTGETLLVDGGRSLRMAESRRR